MKRIIGIISLLLLCNSILLFSAHAQNNYTPAMPTPMPASPTSRIFQKFLGYPISHATGTIDVQIPLYTLNVHDWSAPFTLKYHSSGVRVQDPVGIVGRNWAMFPGFKISRMVKGKPDDIYPVTDKGSDPGIEDLLRLSSPYSSCECTDSRGIDTNRMDAQYDIFQVNLPGISSSFILQRINGTDVVKQIPETSLKITPILDNSTNFIYDHLYGFKIQDDKGICYVFGESAPPRGAVPNFLERLRDGTSWCGWMLREIILPGGDKISFTYQSVAESIPLFNRTITVLDNGISVGIAGCYHDDMINSFTGSDSPFWRFLGATGYQVIEGYDFPHYANNVSMVPLTITAPNETITFRYNERSMLQSITAKQSNGNLIKQVQLLYDNTATKTLLKKVDMAGEGCYELLYKNEGIVSNSGFDWWGFYNGTTSHGSGLPNIDISLIVSRGAISNGKETRIGHSANRTPVASFMDTHSLIEMVSPTKGRLKINYEPHQFRVKGVNRIGEGLRVQSTELYDPVSGKRIVKSYSYDDVHYSEHDYPDAQSLVSIGYICPLDAGACTVRQRVLSVFSCYSNVRDNLSHVWYGKVTETTSDWKKIYVYNFKPDEYNAVAYDIYTNYHFRIEYLLSRLNSMLYPAPWLLSETSYRKTATGYDKVEAMTHTYSSTRSDLDGRIVTPYLFPYIGYSFSGNSICNFRNMYAFCSNTKYYNFYGSPVLNTSYSITCGYHHLTSTRQATYTGNDSIVKEVTYAYDAERHYNISQKTTLLGGADKLVDKYYYSNNTIPDLATLTSAQKTAVSSLTSRNYLTTPVQMTQEKNGSMLYSVLKGYGELSTSTMVVQDEYYRKGSTGLMKKRITYPKYDRYGNLIYACKDDKEKVVYLWSYKGQYLVAEIKGVDYSQVRSALSPSTPESLSELASPPAGILNGLRGKLKTALITTYTYAPGIGVTSMTAPNGEITTYEYDTSGRLIKVKDYNGKVIEQYEYHY